MTHPSFPATPFWAAYSIFHFFLPGAALASYQKPWTGRHLARSQGHSAQSLALAAAAHFVLRGVHWQVPQRGERQPAPVGRMEAHQLSSSCPHVVSPALQQKPGLLPEYVKVERGLNSGSGCSAGLESLAGWNGARIEEARKKLCGAGRHMRA